MKKNWDKLAHEFDLAGRIKEGKGRSRKEKAKKVGGVGRGEDTILSWGEWQKRQSSSWFIINASEASAWHHTAIQLKHHSLNETSQVLKYLDGQWLNRHTRPRAEMSPNAKCAKQRKWSLHLATTVDSHKVALLFHIDSWPVNQFNTSKNSMITKRADLVLGQGRGFPNRCSSQPWLP